MGKKKKDKSSVKSTEAKPKKGLKKECCEKYLKKGEHKRCKRCPCFDMTKEQRIKRLSIPIANLPGFKTQEVSKLGNKLE